MKCPICTVSTTDSNVCEACGYDMGAPDAASPLKLKAARDAFKQKLTGMDPEKPVRTWQKIRIWLTVAVGIALFFTIYRMYTFEL